MRTTRSAMLSGLVALIVAMPVKAQGQTSTIAGVLTDAETGAAIDAAVIELVATGRRTLTVADGRFLIEDVPAGRYLLRVTHVAYGTHGDSVTVETGKALTLALRLTPAAIRLESIDVEADVRRRPEAIRSYTITREQIESALGRARNVGDVVRSYIPGAKVTEYRGGLLCLEFRGASGNRTRGCNFPLVLVDDVPIRYAAEYLRDVPLEDIERLEFIPASQGAARYGMESQYGVLVIETRRSGLAARRQTPRTTTTSYPAYQWAVEPAGHPWERTLAGSVAGNALGVAVGLLALNCFSAHAGDCVADRGVGVGLAAVALPIVGATLGARLFGETAGSRGRLLQTAIAATIPIVLGYAMYRDGRNASFGSSETIGGALVLLGGPLAATLADGLFRRRTGSDER